MPFLGIFIVWAKTTLMEGFGTTFYMFRCSEDGETGGWGKNNTNGGVQNNLLYVQIGIRLVLVGGRLFPRFTLKSTMNSHFMNIQYIVDLAVVCILIIKNRPVWFACFRPTFHVIFQKFGWSWNPGVLWRSRWACWTLARPPWLTRRECTDCSPARRGRGAAPAE